MNISRLPLIAACLCLPVFAQQLVLEPRVPEPRAPEPVADPIPDRIEKGDIAVALEDLVQLPRLADSSAVPRTTNAHARIQYLHFVPDGSGRLAVNDLRGVLYLIDADGGSAHVFLDFREQDVGFDDSMFPNETGLLGFAFHPDFGRAGAPGHGRLYTAYSATSDSGVADYLEHDSENHESVIREWVVDDPSANEFSGSSREVFRIGQFAENHNIGNLAFNPASAPDDSDYGMLYASLGDGGGANDPGEYGQSASEPLSSIMRIDPLGDNGSRYRIPPDNPFVEREGFAPEIWAWGLRHPQHFSFDSDGTMYINDIGQTQIEEVNIGVPGANYGWRLREGTFATAFGIGGVRPNPVYPRPEDEQAFEYPVAQFDHDEGRAISSGYVYRGGSIPELQGNYVFADLVTGRIFYIETGDLTPGDPARIRELRVFIEGEERNIGEALGHPNTYGQGKRADLRLGIDAQGELYALTKGDGWVRKLMPGR